jgi:His/Glu/Gln/Arg/opine family amino acid ABC transporter permease subunit
MQIALAYSDLRWADLWFLLQGAANTVFVTLLAGSLGTLLGCLLGWAREASSVSRIILAPYVDATRSVPLIIQFILLDSFFSISGYPLDPFWLGTIALSLYMGVLTSELVRAGLASVLPQVCRAARSLGLTYFQELWHISAPLALRTSLAGWIGLVLGLAKDSSLLGVIGYLELLRASKILDNRTHQTLLLLAGVGAFYFAICYPISLYSRRLERELAT